MNFKDIYRDANNELHGDEKILLRLLSDKPKRTGFRISYLMPAAAVFAAVAVIVALPVNLADDKGVRIANTVTEYAVEDAPEISPVPKEDTVSTKLDEVVDSSQNTYYAAEEVLEPAYDDLPQDYGSLNINYVEQLSGHEPVAAMGRMIPAEKEMSAQEYSEYIGRDVSSEAQIPADMLFAEPSSVLAEVDGESGEILKEKGTYLAHSEDYGRFAEITVSKTDEIEISGEYEQSDILGNEITVLSDGTDYSASFAQDDVRYLIRTGGLSEEELLNLLKSLNGGNNYEKENFDGNNGGNDGDVIGSGSIG